jgi:phosphoribosylanthranilate isomerase
MFGDKRSDRIQVKICGITNLSDALAAIDCGADALGFNFYPGSRRYIDIETARDWIDKLPGDVCKVAVLVDPSLDEAIRVNELRFIDALQLHGQESPEFCRGLAEKRVRFAKALRVTGESSLVDVPSYHTSMLVLDSMTCGKFGGTGRTFPWKWARRFVKSHPGLNIVLAGGLTPENVAQAISEARPSGVDVTTGVESSARYKDRGRLRAFIEAVRSQEP